MKKDEILAVALRVGAVFLVLAVLGSSVPIMVDAAGTSWKGPWIPLAAMNLLLLLVAFLLWRHALPISRKLLPADSAAPTTEATPPKWTFRSVQEVVLPLLGVQALIRGLPELGYWISFSSQTGNDGLSATVGLGGNDYARLVSAALEVLLGFWLLLGSKGIANFLHRMRWAGLSEEPSSS